MKNKLFFSSLIIISMVFSGLNVSLADGNNTLSSDDMTFSIPSMTTIETDSSSVLSSNATITSDTSLTLSSPLTAIFNVSTLEEDGVYIAISSTSPVNTNSSIASYHFSNYPASGYIVFTKADGSSTSEAVSNALGYQNVVAANNPNAITFNMYCDKNNKTPYEQGDNTAIHMMGHSYDDFGSDILHIRGEDEITCTINDDSRSGTFGMNDSYGNYTATLLVTQFVGKEAYLD